MIDFLDNTADQLVAMLFDRDAKTAEAIILADDKLDNLHHQTFDLALSDDITRQQTVDIVLLGRFLERLGDHAVSAAAAWCTSSPVSTRPRSRPATKTPTSTEVPSPLLAFSLTRWVVSVWKPPSRLYVADDLGQNIIRG